MEVSFVWIASPIFAPFPVKDGRRNSAVIDYVANSLALGSFSVFADLLYKVSSFI